MSETEAKNPPSVYEHLSVMIDQIASVAWQKLGLHPDIMTGRIEANLAEAKVAIDVTAFLSQQIEPQLDDEDRRKIQGLVRDLRLNFVQKSREAGS